MKNIYTVSQINKYVKNVISKDMILSGLWVKGEISNYKHHYSGHMYFTLKDEKGLLRCVMFRSRNSALDFNPENGMKVVIRGYVSVFERNGQYQLYAEEMVPDGIGNLYIAFEQLKKKLKQEGLFDEAGKKKIPYLPRTIGVVTSSTGAVIRDIIHVLDRRFKNVELKVFPVAVQGKYASGQIAHAIKRLNELDCIDVIIVARGGGSLEELWAFNEEIVARSIYKSSIPVISAVGHETDFTISDFAADVRAPTPSAAAEVVVPEKAVLKSVIDGFALRLRNSVIRNIDKRSERYKELTRNHVFKRPYERINQERLRLDVLNKYLLNSMESHKERIKNKLGSLTEKLDALSPLSVLTRGYSIVWSAEDGSIVKSVKDMNKGDRVEIKLKDGKMDCTVNGITTD